MSGRESAAPGLGRIEVGAEGARLSRGEMILKGALGVGALYGIGMVGPYVREALAAGKGGDVQALNSLLLFEYLQEELYHRGNREVDDHENRMTFPRAQKELVDQLFVEERQHVAAVKALVEKRGGKPAAVREYAFAYLDPDVFFLIAGELERSAIGAYNGALPLMKSKEAKDLAASIVQVEGRHAAAVNLQRAEEPAPEAFDQGKTEYISVLSVEKYTGAY